VVRTRFAPSPTGSLHVGNARIAVLNWLLARKHEGAFILRIEDTDAERNVPGAEAGVLADLRWLGLDWDEGPGDGAGNRGERGPYRQSERLEIYQAHAEILRRAGHAYPCFCSAERLEAQRAEALVRGENPGYDGTCRSLAPEAAAALQREGRPAVLRFRTPEAGTIRVQDAVRGAIDFAAAEVSDFVLLRSDGSPTYNFAVVVDDVLMDVTHVIRGSGHLSNTPRQILLFHALERPAPTFAHVPTVLGPDRQKLSKRHGAAALADYRAEGIHPDGLLNYLSLLSWSSPSGDEVLTRERLIQEISLERIGVADAIFDRTKLLWLSARHIERMPPCSPSSTASGSPSRSTPSPSRSPPSARTWRASPTSTTSSRRS
jgi:nondiscriminating glutamyl-tRNA synthetase